MPYDVPSIEELRRQAHAQGIDPSDDDLVLVQGFLTFLFPQFADLEHLVPPDTVPAAVHRPEVEQ
jgi:hypothetical protein